MSPRARPAAAPAAAAAGSESGSAAAAGGPQETRRTTGLPSDPQWYKDAVIYQVHLRAFLDSDGDGIGDFAGLTRKLDYIRDLGVTAVWILPFYPSPLRDDGYDIADYTTVHPDYGTLKDARRFIREAHRRGLRVITEMVCNHTSDQHPWFQRARRAPAGSDFRDFYVWSDTPDRYPDARIIFKDFETSNWSWDPVAQAYFWHRFYGHQPDLNFDNPSVQRALFQALDFWLEMGVDGVRLDAIPYLYERDGTNCENLPETHAFLRALRAHVDERFADRMLLAEANQWPEESVAYFGDGDECQMAFHFPVMPRMFMAIRMEDRFPIIDILDQTPAIPENSQWAIFLRNHDELTLEMVTDEERDYMYRVYADDPQARINLGIRRRLTPLLGNNRRRIELMNGLLLSLPGTPVVYYGDEIGMGDNVYLGDRNGVRTPMQWSADRNAGFSTANPQRLYLPIVSSPEYHYEAVNVETQLQNPHSLLWWMKRVIALRKQHAAFGRGALTFLQPDNRKVLAFTRHWDDETILVIANLSRFSQWTHLDLSQYEGLIPTEMFGSVAFPRISRDAYLMTLAPHSFMWLQLTADSMTPAFADPDAGLPSLVWTGRFDGLSGTQQAALVKVLLAWMRQRRWFRGKARTVKSASVVDTLPLGSADQRAAILLLRVEFAEGEPETYALPVVAARGAEVDRVLSEAPQAAIARLEGGPDDLRLLDATLVPSTCEALLGMMTERRRVRGTTGTLVGRATPQLRIAAGIAAAGSGPTALRGEQSNSSAVFGDQLMLKLYRVLDPGINPDVEVARFLAEHGFPHVPPVLGDLEYRTPSGQPATLAMAQGFIANAGDMWEMSRDAAAAFLEIAEAESDVPPSAAATTAALIARSGEGSPALAHRLIGAYLETARLVGERVGEMHLALAAGGSDPAFTPESMTPFHLRSLYQSIRTSVAEAMRLLRRRSHSLPELMQADVTAALEAATGIDARLRRLLDTRIGGQRIRIHGDLHLGQMLYTGRDVTIIDFEGEPARPLSERRLRRSALTDVAGLLRSFDYAVSSVLLDRTNAADTADPPEAIAAWAAFWYQSVAAACLRGYRDVTAGAAFLPQNDEAFGTLLDSLMLSKVAYELGYELNSRPDQVGIPLRGMIELLSERPPSA